MARLLIVGVDSMLGSNLALALSDRFEVVGLCERKSFRLAGCRTAACRLDDPQAVAHAVRRRRAPWIIHCGPLAQASWDVRHRSELSPAAASVVLAVAAAARQSGSRLTVLSTDAIFAGPRMFHDEQSHGRAAGATRPLVRKTERALEKYDVLVVRTHCFGWSPRGQRPLWAERLATALAEAQPLPAPAPQHATPILAADLAALLLRSYQLDVRGLIHLSGAERTSPRRFATELAAAWGPTAARHAPLAELAEPVPGAVAQETSLDTRRARRLLGRPMPMLRESLARFVAEAFDGHRQRLRNTETNVRRQRAA